MFIFILKVYFLLYCMDLSDKGEIFEYVNTLYLHLKGDKKRQTKRSFKALWKEDHMCHIMMMALYDAFDKWSERENEEEWVWEKDNLNMEGTISVKQHKRKFHFIQKEMEELETKLEKVENGKGYISEESHEEQMKELKQEKEQIIQEYGNTIGKLRNTESALREKLEAQEKRFIGMENYFKQQIDILS